MDILHCAVSWNPQFLVFTSQAPKLLYYSHIPTALTALSLGVFVFIKSKHSLAGKILLFISVMFSLWSFTDLYIWTNSNSSAMSFLWSLINLFEILVSVSILYFSYVFIEDKDAPLKYKAIFFALFLPFLVLMPTRINLAGFDLTICEATQGKLVYYFYFLESFFLVWLLVYLIRKIINTSKEERKKTIFISLGASLFLISFSGTNIIGSAIAYFLGSDVSGTNWEITQYGLFGMTVFMGFLAYLIVKFKVFEIKMLAAEALVAALVILLFSEFFFIGIENTTATVLISVTILLSTIFGIWLINSVRNEVKRKEELQVMSDNLAVANDKLKKLDNAKSEFISIASHQLRTPLTAIKGYVSLIIEGTFGKVDPKIKDALGKTYVANERLIKLVEDLLNVSRIESGRLEFDMQPQQVENIVKGLADDFIFAAKKSGLYLHINLPETPLPPVKIDKAKITEVISNMIDNSIKYTKRGGVTVRAELVKSQYPNPNIQQNPKIQNTKYDIQATGAVRITVSDTGIGIPAENLPYLFAKFSRGKDTSKLHASGTGLGMFVAKNIAEAHGGRIWAESDGENKGSRFIVELPVESGKL